MSDQTTSHTGQGLCLTSILILLTATASVPAQTLEGNVSCIDITPATPLAGITVVASGLQGDVVTSLTDSNGNYTMTLMPNFPYDVTLTNLPLGLSYVSPASGTQLALVPPLGKASANFTLSGCGQAPLGILGDTVWNDLNCDGIQDWDEPGMSGVTVLLTDCSGTILKETTTDGDGYYWFTELSAGGYALTFVKPPGYSFSPVDQGNDPARDSDADPDTGATVCITLGEGQIDDTWDAGLCRLETPGVRSQGYWKNHPRAWPVSDIQIGGITYDKWEAILIMRLPTKGDKSLNMFEQLVAAKLNVLVGNESDCIADTIEEADEWMAIHPGPTPARSPAWKYDGQYLHSQLDAYNNGYLCAPPAY